MQTSSINAQGAASGGRSDIGRLLSAIAYPVRAPAGAVSFTILADGMEISVLGAGGSMRLTCNLTDNAEMLPRLAGYAAGRIMRENAVLAFDRKSGSAFLWTEFDGSADMSTLRRSFEEFADSCEWWRSRMDAQGGAADAPAFPEMMIRP